MSNYLIWNKNALHPLQNTQSLV